MALCKKADRVCSRSERKTTYILSRYFCVDNFNYSTCKISFKFHRLSVFSLNNAIIFRNSRQTVLLFLVLVSPSAYRNFFLTMLDDGNGTRQLYSTSFVQHRRRFVENKPDHVKELIRLVKYWASRFLPKKLQKSYPLELITIYLWEKAGKPSALSKAQGLRSVLEVLTNLDSLRVYWSYMAGVDYQLNETIIRKLDMRR